MAGLQDIGFDKKMNNKVSVIIYGENNKYELVRTAKSVFKQLYTPLEVIILDYSDSNICEEFLAKNIQEEYLYVPMRHVKGNYDFIDMVKDGLKLASGEWITFLNGYCKWSRKRIDSIKQYLKEEELVVITSRYICNSKSSVFQAPLMCDQVKGNGKIVLFSSLNYTVFRKNYILKEIERTQRNLFTWHWYFIENLTRNQNVKCIQTDMFAGEEWILFDGNRQAVCEMQMEVLSFYQQLQEIIWRSKQGYAFYCLFNKMFLDSYSEAVLLEKFMDVTDDKNLRQFLSEYQLDVEQQKKDAERKVKRQASFYQLMAKWVQLGLEGKKLSNYLQKNHKNKICIYGAGKHGLMLAKSLAQEGMKITCFIDKKLAGTKVEDVSVYPLTAALPELDLIIVSPYLELSNIERELHHFTTVDIMPMDQLITLCGEQ